MIDDADEVAAGFSAANLIEWAAHLEVAVTHGYELASIDRHLEPAGQVLVDQLDGMPCGTAADVRDRWPDLAEVEDRTDPVFVAVVLFVLNRVRVLRTTAYDMARCVVQREAA